MKWFQILILGIFLSFPLVGNSVVVYNNGSQIITSEIQIKKAKQKPKKTFKRWIKNNAGLLFFGGLTLAGIFMIIFGILKCIKWLWLTGIFVVFGPWILAVFIVIFALIFGFGYKKPMLSPEIPEPEKKKKE